MSTFRNIMGCTGIGEASLGVILLSMVFLTCRLYWMYVYGYKESHCGSRYRYHPDENRNESEVMSTNYEYGYGYEYGHEYVYEPELTDTCLLTTEREASKTDLKKCQFFDVEDQTLPHSVGVQTIVALSVSIFIGALGIRAKSRFTSYGFTNDMLGDSAYTDEINNKKVKHNFWTINFMLTVMLVGMFGFSHLYYLKYTDVCIESPIDDYDGDEIVTYGKTIFYAFLVLVGIYNYIWYYCITNKSCCCSHPQYVYWIINMLMSASMMIFIYTLSKTQIMLPIVFTLYAIAYFVCGNNYPQIRIQAKVGEQGRKQQ